MHSMLIQKVSKSFSIFTTQIMATTQLLLASQPPLPLMAANVMLKPGSTFTTPHDFSCLCIKSGSFGGAVC